jgi:hypothetical protein
MSETVIDIDVEEFFEAVSVEVQEELEQLTMSDVAVYEANGPSSTAPRVANISFRHHRMAQLVALGYPQTKVATMLDCTIQTVCRLCRDPSFQILVKAELEKLQTRDHAIQVKMEEVAEIGLDRLHDMLVNAEEPLKPLAVHKITTDILDRAGHGPRKELQVTKSFGIEAETLERIKSSATTASRLLPPSEPPDAGEASDCEAQVGPVGGESVPSDEVSERGDGPGTCIPTEILPLAREGGS